MWRFILLFLGFGAVAICQDERMFYPLLTSNVRSTGVLLLAEVTKYGVMGIGYSMASEEKSDAIYVYSGTKKITTLLHKRESAGELKGGVRLGWLMILIGFDLLNKEEQMQNGNWHSVDLDLVPAAAVIFNYQNLVIGIGGSQGVRGYLGVGF